MKILYSCSNRIGAGIQLTRFLENVHHEVRIAGYMRPTESLSHIDWTLDALTHSNCIKNNSELINLFGHKMLPRVCFDGVVTLLEEISEYNPDLVICDAEPIVANIAITLGFKLWYISPMHLLDGIQWKRGQLKYHSLLESTRKAVSM